MFYSYVSNHSQCKQILSHEEKLEEKREGFQKLA